MPFLSTTYMHIAASTKYPSRETSQGFEVNLIQAFGLFTRPHHARNGAAAWHTLLKPCNTAVIEMLLLLYTICMHLPLAEDTWCRHANTACVTSVSWSFSTVSTLLQSATIALMRRLCSALHRSVQCDVGFPETEHTEPHDLTYRTPPAEHTGPPV